MNAGLILCAVGLHAWRVVAVWPGWYDGRCRRCGAAPAPDGAGWG